MDSLRGLRDSLDSSRPRAGASNRYEKTLNSEFKGERSRRRTETRARLCASVCADMLNIECALLGSSSPTPLIAAALHLTNLYRNSLASSQNSYRSGYVQALRDILDLIVLRTAQGLSGVANVDDLMNDDADPMSSASSSRAQPSQQEVRWLARYLRARIDAIKSESDGEDDDGDNEADANTSQHPMRHSREDTAASGSSQVDAGSSRLRNPGDTADNQAASSHLSRLREHQESPAPSTAPTTPEAMRTSRQQLPQQPQRSVSASTAVPQTLSHAQRPAAPSSAFSFSARPSEATASQSADSFQHASPSHFNLNMSSAASSSSPPSATSTPVRRRTRALPAHLVSHRPHSSGSSGLGHAYTPTRQASSPTPLSTVGEEAVRPLQAGSLSFSSAVSDADSSGIDLDDERDERPNGRRGALLQGGREGGIMGGTSGGPGQRDRSKRRRRLAAEKMSMGSGTGGASGGDGPTAT